MDTTVVLTTAKAAIIRGTHSFDGGFVVELEEIERQLLSLHGQDGITLSGGDPLFQVEPCLELAKFCKQHGLNVWCYTGFMFEQLLEMSEKNKKILEFLGSIDVLVDGKYIEEKRSLNLLFRGSTNQRIIDVQNSLKQGKIVEKAEKEKFFQENYGKNGNIYI